MTIRISDKTIEIIKTIIPFLVSSIDESRLRFGERFDQIADELCCDLFAIYDNNEEKYKMAVDGYVRFCIDHLRLQKKLEKEGHYLNDDFDKINEEVYSNDEAMNGYYLNGLYLSTIFWPNHLQMFLFFIDKFSKDIIKDGNCCEIGVGHGLLISTLLKNRVDVKVLGIDVSKPALDFTEKLLIKRSNKNLKFKLELCDIRKGLNVEDATFDSVIFAEVLEHLDNPQNAIREVARILKPCGTVYITAAIFAANVDHLYLFKSVDEVVALIEDVGLCIKEQLVLPVRNTDSGKLSGVPVNYACYAEKRVG